jgi:hypothetical protein
MAKKQDILAKHDKFIDSLVDVFDDRLGTLIDGAQKRTLKRLEGGLTFASDGSIEFTPANQRVLRSVDRIFKQEMNRSTRQTPGGYKQLAQAFSNQFSDHLPRFQDVLNDLSDTMETPLPKIKFDKADVDLFASQAVGAKDLLMDVIDSTGNAAKRQALFNVGGMKFSDLTETLADQFSKTGSQAKAIADTSSSMLYRSVANQAYKKIEAALAPGAVRYIYLGPDDSLTRPFCEMLLNRTAAKSMTREEIEALDNGSGLPVITSGGGWNCRHSIVLALDSDAAKAA